MEIFCSVGWLSIYLSAFFLDSGSPPLQPRIRHSRDGLDKRRPGWSPDGKCRAFARQEADGIHLWQYMWDLGGSATPRRLLSDYDPPHFDAIFSPDGTRLLLSTIRFSGTQGNVDIVAVKADG